MNKLIIFGTLGQDAQVRQAAANGSTPISFTVAVTEKRGETEHTEWFNCTKWIQAGGSTKVADYLKKGTRVCVSGKVSVRAYVDRDQQARASLEVNVQELTLGGQPQANAQTTTAQPQARAAATPSPANPSTDAGDDLPF